jgi:Kazal-type serine protease inhibitor domain
MHGFKVLASLAFLLALPPSGSLGATLGETCDGIAGLRCDEGLWCEHAAGQCNMADAAGHCIKAPDICTQDYNPICGCDGETFGNQCMAMVAKVQVDYIGECAQ